MLLSGGTRLTPSAIGLAASVGSATVSVYKRPRVAILSTGDEIIDVTSSPGPNQIRNSNTYSLFVQVQSAGGMPLMLPIAPDRAEPLRELIEQGLHGRSAASFRRRFHGEIRLGRTNLCRAGRRVLLHGRADSAGKANRVRPRICFGNGEGHLFLRTAGNPVSTMVCFELFARPMIEALSGASPNPLRFLQARLKSDVKTKTGLTRFLPAQLSGEFADVEVELVRWQGSGDMVSTARANCYLVIPPDREKFACRRDGFSAHYKQLMAKKKLSHYDSSGRASMVDVSEKKATKREAEASAQVLMSKAVLKALPQNPKGDPLEVARIAGIQAAKRTSDLIPMCHPLPLSHVDVDIRLCENGVAITSRVTTTAETGVEMEALVAASVAALTVYDMCKALDKGIEIREVVLQKKSGGKSGDYRRTARKRS